MKHLYPWLLVALVTVYVAARVIWILTILRKRKRHQRWVEEQCRAIEPNETVKEFVRPGGTERIRIFRRPDASFGVVFEAVEAGSWRPKQVLGAGAVYDSAEAAERETTVLQRWLQANEWPKLA